MCGIIGEISEKIDRNKFIRMRDKLTHRGPDDEGLYMNKSQNVALGHRRLSIIDLSPKGNQPMKNEDGTIWITFNGEIYNYQNIREELIIVDGSNVIMTEVKAAPKLPVNRGRIKNLKMCLDTLREAGFNPHVWIRPDLFESEG